MDSNLIKILVLAKTGHFRDSLLALLKTIPGVFTDLRDAGWVSLQTFEFPETDLVILDQEFLNQEAETNIENIKFLFPNAKLLLFTQKVWQPNLYLSMAVDCVLPKSTSTGEFLLVIKQLTSPPDFSEKVPSLSPNYLHSAFGPGVVN